MAYPERVLNKARELRSNFGLTLEEIVQKLDDEFGDRPSVKTVGRWLKPDTPKASPTRQAPQDRFATARHQQQVMGLLVEASTELKQKFLRSYPTVFQGYRPDRSDQRLEWVNVGGAQEVGWSLLVESQPIWNLAVQHLETGLPEAAGILRGIKTSYSEYCQGLIGAEDFLRRDAKANHDGGMGGTTLNESHFFRSIMGEVDKEDREPSEDEYVLDSGLSRTTVVFDGVELLVAEERGVADCWLIRHVGWRALFIREYKPGLVQLRREIKTQVAVFANSIQAIEIDGVSGSCERCPNRQRMRTQ